VYTGLYVRRPFTQLSHAPQPGCLRWLDRTAPIPNPIPSHTYIHTHILRTYIHTSSHTRPTHTTTTIPNPLCYCSFLHARYSNLAQPSPARSLYRLAHYHLIPETVSISPSPPPPLHDLHLAPITSSCYAPTYQKRLPACEPATTTCDLPVWSLHKYCPVLFYVDAASAVLRYIHTVLLAQPSWPKSPRQPPCVPGQV
jgi:hypothetical protein